MSNAPFPVKLRCETTRHTWVGSPWTRGDGHYSPVTRYRVCQDCLAVMQSEGETQRHESLTGPRWYAEVWSPVERATAAYVLGRTLAPRVVIERLAEWEMTSAEFFSDPKPATSPHTAP